MAAKSNAKPAASESDISKNLGNVAFAAGRLEEAVDHFTNAIKVDPSNHVLYSNRSAANTALGKADKDALQLAVSDAKKCVELKPDFAKGYSRQGTALFMLGKYSEAVKCYAMGLAHDPSSRLLADGLAQAQKKLADNNGKDQDDDMSVVDEKKASDVVIGIDLGTTYSCVGVWRGKTVVMIPNERGNLTSPSWVCFSDTGKRFVGQAAKNMAAKYPSNTIYDVKRFIGQRMEDEGVQADCDKLTYKVIGQESSSANGKSTGKPMIQVDFGMHGKKTFAAEEISAMVLSYLKRTAEQYLGHTVQKAVITVPAYFNDSQRSATKAAGRIAGLEVLRIINEPTAAALSYGLDRRHKEQAAKVLIFDLGGGTFDVSVLAIEGGVTEVKATGGDTRLGGEDFDNIVTKTLIQESTAKGLPDVSKDFRAIRRLQLQVEQAKRQLSESEEAKIHIDSFFTTTEKLKGTNNYKTLDFDATLTRARFESLNAVYFTKCLETVKKVLKDAKVKASEIDDVVLVGGSTRIPKMQSMLQQYFGGKDLCKTLNPDEAVAYGAAVQGAILNGQRSKETDNLLLLDVTPLSLGIETTGKVMSVIIPRNSSIPCVKTQTYTTEIDNQDAIDVCVYEGERAKTDENNFLGKFNIAGIERAKRGVPKIDVSFALDSNGILGVTAKDQTTGAEAAIQIQRSGRSSEGDIERMVKDAAKYRDEDEAAIKKVESINEFETLISEVKDLAAELAESQINKSQALEQAAQEAQNWIDEQSEEAKVSEVKLMKRKLELTLKKNKK